MLFGQVLQSGLGSLRVSTQARGHRRLEQRLIIPAPW
jgi:hypothetical protein